MLAKLDQCPGHVGDADPHLAIFREHDDITTVSHVHTPYLGAWSQSHRTLPIQGVQFHPESILSVGGHDLLRNFLALTAAA